MLIAPPRIASRVLTVRVPRAGTSLFRTSTAAVANGGSLTAVLPTYRTVVARTPTIEIPVYFIDGLVNGLYRLRLHFAEVFFGAGAGLP
jgi:hypothetical protein